MAMRILLACWLLIGGIGMACGIVENLSAEGIKGSRHLAFQGFVRAQSGARWLLREGSVGGLQPVGADKKAGRGRGLSSTQAKVWGVVCPSSQTSIGALSGVARRGASLIAWTMGGLPALAELGEAATGVAAVVDQSTIPSEIGQVLRIVVLTGVVVGMVLLYLPPKVETVDTIELEAENREELIQAVIKFTGENPFEEEEEDTMAGRQKGAKAGNKDAKT